MSAFTYIARDSFGRAVYVGCTEHPGQRIGQHARSRALWTRLAESVEWQWHPSREAALAAESELIATLLPMMNIIGKPEHGPDSDLTWYQKVRERKRLALAALRTPNPGPQAAAPSTPLGRRIQAAS